MWAYWASYTRQATERSAVTGDANSVTEGRKRPLFTILRLQIGHLDALIELECLGFSPNAIHGDRSGIIQCYTRYSVMHDNYKKTRVFSEAILRRLFEIESGPT